MTKFKFNGENGMVDLTLIMEKVLPIDEVLENGKIYEIPESNPVIKRVRANGNWVEIKEAKSKPKTTKKGE